jgi:hypothetical protein
MKMGKRVLGTQPAELETGSRRVQDRAKGLAGWLEECLWEGCREKIPHGRMV